MKFLINIIAKSHLNKASKVIDMSLSLESAFDQNTDARTMSIVRELNNFDKICFKQCIALPDKKLSHENENCLSKHNIARI